MTTVLLTLPGSAFPEEDWLDRIYFDKWVHVFLFAVMTWLGCRTIMAGMETAIWARGFVWMALACFLYGFGMELVQHFLIIRRSFDVMDILADGAGCLAGWGIGHKRYIKNKPL